MNTVTGNLTDLRSMVASERSSEAKFFLRRWFAALTDGKSLAERLSARQQACALRLYAQDMMPTDRRLAADLSAAADMHELRHGDR